MFRMSFLLSGLAVLSLAAGLSGCGQSAKSDKKPESKPSETKKQDAPAGSVSREEHAGGKHAEAGGSESKHADKLAELSPEDRALAEKQKVCPVSGEPLGSMGKPYKVEVKGRTVFLCCQGCEAEIKSDPDKYLAKLDAK